MNYRHWKVIQIVFGVFLGHHRVRFGMHNKESWASEVFRCSYARPTYIIQWHIYLVF